MGGATLAACSAFYFEAVTVKLLPFDNKSELTVLVNLPEGTSLEATEQALFAANRIAGELPEVTAVQAYAGTPQPFDFNGLVRHYYLRQSPELGELHLELQPKDVRSRSSHAIALDLRQRLAALTLPEGTVLKVVEVPPGPPVMATLLAEVYGPDAASRRATAEELKTVFRSVPFIVDVDDSYGHAAAAPAHLHRPGSAGILRRRAKRCLRHGAGVVRRRARRLLLSRRGPVSAEHHRGPAEARPELERDGWPPRRCPRTPCPAIAAWSNWARWCRPNPKPAAACCSAATDISPTW